MFLLQPSFLLLLAPFVIVGAVFAIQAMVEMRRVREDAKLDHDFRTSRGMKGGEQALDVYERAYIKVHAPRKQMHIATLCFLLALTTPLILRAADLLMTGIYSLSGDDRTFEPTFLVYQFGIYFLTIMFWAFMALFVARHFHQNAIERVEDVLYHPENLPKKSPRQDALKLLLIMGGSLGAIYLTFLVFSVLGLFGVLGLFAIYGAIGATTPKLRSR